MDWTQIFIKLAALGIDLAPILLALNEKSEDELTDQQRADKRAMTLGLSAAIQAAGAPPS